ncbi:CehA/McbA family metallohydrolase [Flavilitoribacter nigricans]|uniref:Histidinol-phosphatase n=1 Tax=Flavilitoribacter nigricans (strain ATCC 23147 / DSM 23189 / NBRC 102662 / NCIMB 1420 / SS-2) TaxID=1122177 RepID=A0A2D0NAA7_FLAN2|nr:CehA/McbA family metallohydrolase [Flavilitoribacter nigricans]PHN05452.1 hypothetical protein CRP01_15765 [Flavilitoribacter nigricans DSM 23189 = NBRC 102662]
MKKLYFFLIPALFFACSSQPEMAEEEPTVWFKGNTHAHTVVCGHADTSPDSVALWYLERDYNFLILSEHNNFIDPDSVNLPAGHRTDFILVPGEEVTGRQAIHTTGMNVQHYVEGQPSYPYDASLSADDPNLPPETKTSVIQQHTDSVLHAGGLPILNHPNFVSGAQVGDIRPVKRLHLFELYNGHPAVYNFGNEQHIAVEAKWDSLLTSGMLILGVSSDDAHQFQTWSEDVSNPGRGWVMVDSEGELTPDAITQAMARGNFYATNGVMLAEVHHSADRYVIQIDTNWTRQAMESPYIIGKKTTEGTTGFKVEFFGDGGALLHTSTDLQIDFPIDYEGGYVRGKVSFTRQLADGQFETFYAWTQPRFLDERAGMLDNNEVWSPNHDHDHEHGHDH